MRIHVLAAALSCAVLVGCGGGSSSNTPPPTPPAPPSPSLAVTSPKDGATVFGEPVTVSVTASNISNTSQLSVLLDGSDITSKLSAPDANGVRSVQVSQPYVNYGKNQVQVRYQDSRANSTFTLDTVSTGSSAPQPSGTGAELVSVVTRVLKQNADGTYADGTHATDWGIQVGGHYYQAPPPVDQNNQTCTQQCYGYQILLLNRQDLTPIPTNSNMSFEVANYAEIQPTAAFVQELSSLGQGNFDTPPYPGKVAPTACQPNGCIMVMQSLAQIGYNPCYNGSDPNYFAKCSPFVDDPNAVGTLIYWLTKLGASAEVLFANGMKSSHVGYSFIGNAGSGQMPGQGALGAKDSQGNIIVSNTPTSNGQFERLGCLDSRYQNPETICDNLGAGGSAASAGGSTDLQQAGRISGVFIRDNYNLYTFAQNGPQILYTFGTTVASGVPTNVVSINGSTTEGAGQYSMSGLPPGSGGGFRLLILDRTHPDSPNAKQWDKYYNLDPASMDTLANDIVSFADANGLFFLASMGNISHNNEDPVFSPHWEALKDYITGIGGDEMTLRILGDSHPAFNGTTGKDDYLLVGKQIPNAPPAFESFGAGHQSQFTAQEAGYVINRHTLANATSPTQVEGVLVMDHQGYYTPQIQGQQQGIVSQQITSLSSASFLPPSTWPYSGDDTSATSGQQEVYTWISDQLCCSDIRSTYINLNASPAVWLTQLEQLNYENTPEYGKTNPAYSSTEFTDVKNQLGQEFAYLAVVRNLQNNILSLYQDQQSNVSLILDQAASDIKADVDVDDATPTVPTPWSTFTTDVFPVLANLSGFAGPWAGNVAKNALGIGTLVINSAIQHSNDPSGISQTMHALANQEVAEADLAQHAADEYTDSLVTLGNDFKRVVTDWGRLKTVGGPISTGQLVWDPSASGMFLRAFDLTTRRQFYPLLMRSNPDFFITHIKYSDTQYYGRDDHTQLPHDDQCNQSSFHEAQDNLENPGFDSAGEDLRGTAWWPGILQVSAGNSSDTHNPGAYWWDVWALGLGPGTDNRCPLPYWGNLPNTYGMFDPISTGDNFQTNGLGLWKPYIFQYHWVPQVYFNEWYGGSLTP